MSTVCVCVCIDRLYFLSHISACSENPVSTLCVFMYAEALWFLRTDSCPAPCPNSTLSSSCLSTQWSLWVWLSDCFYPLSVLFVLLPPLLVPEHPPPFLLYLRARRQSLLQPLLASVHLETHRSSVRSIHFVFLSLRPLCTLLAPFISNCAQKQMVVLVSEFEQSYASAFSAVCSALEAYISCRESSGY